MDSGMIRWLCVAGAWVAVFASSCWGGGPREDVTFSITQTTTIGRSVFVLGDLPELGAGDLRRAMKLVPTSYPTWSVTVSLPANAAYRYRFYVRDDGAGDLGNPANGVAVGGWIDGSTSAQAQDPAHKTIIFDSTTLDDPVVHILQPAGVAGPSEPIAMREVGIGVSGGTRWAAPSVGVGGRSIEFYFTSATGPGRVPGTGAFATDLDAMLVTSGEVFSYEPSPGYAQARRENVFTFPSSILGENRPYRVVLPRGYDAHTDRRYPVVYMHDGQNVFDQGPFGSWNADETAARMIALGSMREVILVGIDNTGGANRFRDYVPEGDAGGQGSNYARFIRDELKPVIDASYRTIPDASATGSIGSSLGGICALYHGWDWVSVFGRVGAFSGAWPFAGNFVSRVYAEPNRAIRVYLDSGDAGTSNDAYADTFNLRDALVGKSAGGYAVEGALRWVVGWGDQHNEAAWSDRLPGALVFLYPMGEEPPALDHILLAPLGDVNDDGAETLDDVYAFDTGGGPNLDVDREGTPGTEVDRQRLLEIVRAGETGDVAGR